MKANIGLGDNAVKAISNKLAEVLATNYTLVVKTQNFHWNVTGPHFNDLHAMFGAQYEALIPVIDEIAERIRALGQFTPGSLQQFAKHSKIEDAPEKPPEAMNMVRQLAQDHEKLAEVLQETLKIAEEKGDEVTVDLMVGRVAEHQKTAWMLRSIAS